MQPSTGMKCQCVQITGWCVCLKGVYYGKHIISNEQINATLHVMCSKILVRECLKNVVNTLVLL